ncbi:MAG: bifunctional oligoribonuclease/PAP phosphatase NrnA [Clostridia bacterium]|nr:bifunctional oligoribonuclease/PAP phosphatase NrnA [Clostridia bacterium]
MFEAIRKAIEEHETVIIHRHATPDGDALGSQVGLKHLIQENYPGKAVYAVGDGAGRYAFMADAIMDDVPDAAYENALAIVLDTSGRTLISDSRFETAKTTARIDHHLFIEQICQLEAVDTSFESCCGLIAAMAQECNWRMPPLAAQSLFTGMVTDSGRFRYDSSSARTFRLAAYLMEQGVDTGEIYRQLYAADLEQVQLRAAFTQKITLTEHGVAYIYTTREEMAGLNTDLFSISRGMVSLMNDIRGVDIWVNFTEAEQGVLCELRSGRYNINPIAVKYGGGGHMKASGATVKDREEALRMLADLDRMAEENR